MSSTGTASRIVDASGQPATTKHASENNTNDFLWHQLHFQAASQERSLAIFYMVVCLAYFGLALVLFAMTSRGDVDAFYLPFHFSEFFGALVFNSAEAVMIYYTMIDSDSLFLGGGILDTTGVDDQRPPPEDTEEGGERQETALVASKTGALRGETSSTGAAAAVAGDESSSGGGGWLEKNIPILHWSESAILALISLNVAASSVAAVLFAMSPETFEVHSHWIEYSVQITVTLVDTLFITKHASGGRFQSSSSSSININKHVLMLLAYTLLLMAIFKMLLYGEK